MRTIKFRGKRLDNGKWVFGFLTAYLRTRENENEYFIQDDSCDRFLHRVDPETVGQFTGWSESTKTDIYESDLLKSDGYFARFDAEPFTVEFYDCSWWLFSRGKPFERLSASLMKRLSVIGNIFETREDG